MLVQLFGSQVVDSPELIGSKSGTLNPLGCELLLAVSAVSARSDLDRIGLVEVANNGKGTVIMDMHAWWQATHAEEH